MKLTPAAQKAMEKIAAGQAKRARALHLRDVEKLTFPEIGQQMNCTKQHAQQMVVTARMEAKRPGTADDGLNGD